MTDPAIQNKTIFIFLRSFLERAFPGSVDENLSLIKVELIKCLIFRTSFERAKAQIIVFYYIDYTLYYVQMFLEFFCHFSDYGPPVDTKMVVLLYYLQEYIEDLNFRFDIQLKE